MITLDKTNYRIYKICACIALTETNARLLQSQTFREMLLSYQ